MATSEDRGPRVAVDARVTVPGLEAAAVAAVVARAWALHCGPPGAAVEVALLGEAEHTRLHAELMDAPEATDVMALSYRDADLWGEILVNADCARREAAARGARARDEALLYVAHGALHLLGFDDRDAAARAAMRAAEARTLAREKVPPRA